MKITKILDSGKLSLSFEVFPPKTDTVFESVKTATERIASLAPAYVSVTYGAGGGTSEYTLDIAKNIKDRYKVPTVAHMTCVSSTKETVRAMAEKLRACGIENVLALRGDIPADKSLVKGDYLHADDLIRELRSVDAEFCIGAACYPEVHPESENSVTDIKYLKQKVDAGVDFLTTQMFFDNPLFYSFLYRIREKGILVPVIPGIMPITNAKQIERAKQLSGSYMPHRFEQLVDKFGNDPLAMKQAGIAYATDPIIDLYANGIKHIHVYSMNNPEVAEKIMSNLSDIIGK
ncbi:MAG: methylenetetrahydrofolate reductase [Clostridia bacterium]|nr:methylenetetrahydrofolate reductase [NAD(P)H] [Clostridia bacterium]